MRSLRVSKRALIVVRSQPDELAFAEGLRARLAATGGTVEAMHGEPKDARITLVHIAASPAPNGAAASQPSPWRKALTALNPNR